MNDAPRSRRRIPDLTLWLLIATVVAGTILRFVGIFWGLPMTLHADEWVVVEYAIDMAQRNSFEPAFFARPDHLEIQLSYLAYQLWGHLFHGMRPEDLFALAPGPFYAISRGITAAFGSAMIVLAYVIGRVFARRAGLFMAVGVAFFPPFVDNSRYATPDIPLTFTVMVVILGTVLYLRRENWWSLILACAGVALGVTVKYPAAVGAVAIAVAIAIASIRSRHYWRILSRGASAIAIVVAMTFLLSPVLFTNGREVVRQLTAQNSDGHLGASGLGWAGNLAFYAGQMVASGGVLLLVFAVIAVVWAIARKRWEALPLGIGVVFWVAIGALSLHWDRWGLPMYLTVVLLGGLGVWAAWEWAPSVARRWLRRDRAATMARIGVATLAGISGLTLFLSSVATAGYALAPDTRTVAGAEAAAYGATSENTVYDGYTPFHPDGPGSIVSELTVVDDRVVPRSDATDADFVMTSSAMVNRYLAEPSLEEEFTVYTAVVDTLPVVDEWRPSGSPPMGAWEIARIPETLQFLGVLLDGAMSGPHLMLYELDE